MMTSLARLEILNYIDAGNISQIKESATHRIIEGIC